MKFMKRILTIIAVFASTFFTYSAIAQELTLPQGNFESLRKTGAAKVTEVVNPLTVKLDDGRFIHLAGLDYPDLDYYDPGDLAVTAQQILDDFLKGETVIIYQTQSKDQGRINRMGHHIAHLARASDKTWAQGMLLALGVARVRTTQYNPEMGQQMLALENQARNLKVGLWAMDEYAILSPENTASHIGSYQIIEGTVVSVSMRRNKLYLNFGNNWKEDFTVRISSSRRKAYEKNGIAPRRWSGKKIRVRGWIESYNGPFIDIDHPERIEALFANTNTREGQTAERDVSAEKSGDSARPLHPNKGSALPEFND